MSTRLFCGEHWALVESYARALREAEPEQASGSEDPIADGSTTEPDAPAEDTPAPEPESPEDKKKEAEVVGRAKWVFTKAELRNKEVLAKTNASDELVCLLKRTDKDGQRIGIMVRRNGQVGDHYVDDVRTPIDLKKPQHKQDVDFVKKQLKYYRPSTQTAGEILDQWRTVGFNEKGFFVKLYKADDKEGHFTAYDPFKKATYGVGSTSPYSPYGARGAVGQSSKTPRVTPVQYGKKIDWTRLGGR
jgi:hypothetical protein